MDFYGFQDLNQERRIRTKEIKVKNARVYKPGSVLIAQGWRFISALRYRERSCNRPGQPRETPRANMWLAAPIWSCSRWGLPCRCCCQPRGALLPHRFTLTAKRRSILCGTFPWDVPAGRYPASWFRGARTFLLMSQAAIRPLQ